ncbi:MAG TPA: hypothetical protein VFK85_01320 [Anaeromyxobacteraceae bacterium]|nr:hypothetical protein [Anaeromyxobacteraceae bacterium]
MRSLVAIAAALLGGTAHAAERLPPALLPDLVHVAMTTGNAGPSIERGSLPICVADVCPQRVSVPGHEQQFSMRGRRTELALKYLDRIHLEPFATGAWWLVATGLRFDWAPGQNGEAVATGRGGRGRFQAMLRWHLDAFNRPVRPERHRR